MPIIITCKKPGFRRCGIAHPAGPVEYPDKRFTDKELKMLMEEPMLIVLVTMDIGDKETSKKSQKEDSKKKASTESGSNLLEGKLDPAQLETMDYPVLKQLAKDMNLEFKSNIKKTDLVDLIASEPVFAKKTENPNPENTDQLNSSGKESKQGSPDDGNQQSASQDDQTGADQ